ncbi:phage shock protein C [Ligilactobacillus ruminis DPC 6832]|nr:phage shock protein C [Ligilactobacillus ruminis DPC 6832]
MIAEFFPPMVYVVILAYLILALVMPKKPEQYNDVFTLLKDLFSGENRSGSDQSKRSQEQGRKIVTDAKERDVKKRKDDK